ncbi:hypothetical protein ACJX0J_016155, partial [Zea mays]
MALWGLFLSFGMEKHREIQDADQFTGHNNENRDLTIQEWNFRDLVQRIQEIGVQSNGQLYGDASKKLFHSNATASHRYSSIAPIQDNTGSMMINLLHIFLLNSSDDHELHHFYGSLYWLTTTKSNIYPINIARLIKKLPIDKVLSLFVNTGQFEILMVVEFQINLNNALMLQSLVPMLGFCLDINGYENNFVCHILFSHIKTKFILIEGTSNSVVVHVHISF